MTTLSDGYSASVGTIRQPNRRPSLVVVEPVSPLVDGGRFPAKATVGERVPVRADVFATGHAIVRAGLAWRRVTRRAGRSRWMCAPMEPLGNDRFEGWFRPDDLGRWEYDVLGWIDHDDTWRRGLLVKVDAGVDVELETVEGLDRLARLERAASANGDRDAAVVVGSARAALSLGNVEPLRDPQFPDITWTHAPREPVGRLPAVVDVDVDPERARFGAWYEFFPRSPVAPATGHATLRDALDRLDRIAGMGFDVVYLPPVHPVGTLHRKGRNNATTALPGDVGSPWAIGSALGGHDAVDPALGTVDDLVALATACRERGMQLALDIAFQCAPDHPWVAEHPEWFAHRPDGSIQYAENPPKRYEDIYPLDFECDEWRSLWDALLGVIRTWIDRGVTIFRVDNPHTKAFAFWEWALGEVHREHPETIFLAEAFTRPRVMERLAKIGFNQSYTYFAWRSTADELREYFVDLATRTLDHFRPNVWPNTPDILTEELQHGGRATFVTRAVLAATLSPSWGVYGPAFELQEHVARRGSEEYLDSEKYQLRQWDLDAPGSLAPVLAQLNQVRRAEPALAHLRTIWFHLTDNPMLLCFSKTDPDAKGDPVVVVVNLDPRHRQSGFVDLDLTQVGLPHGSTFDLVDLLGGERFTWTGNRNFVELTPWATNAHVMSVRRREVHR